MSNCTRCWAVDCRCGAPSWEASIAAREKAERDAKDRVQARDQRIREAERAVISAAEGFVAASPGVHSFNCYEQLSDAVRALRELKEETP